MTCENCGRPNAYIRYNTRAYGKGDNLVVIEDVPVISCRDCGMDFLTAETLGQLERLRDNPDSVPVRPTHVASFQAQEDPLLAELTGATA